jgi:nucleoside-diphosphate-sugar epimerase
VEKIHRILLTGASGTLGGNFVRLVSDRRDMRILALLREQSRLPSQTANLDCLRINFANARQVRDTVAAFQPTCVVHCAATGMDFPRPEWFDLIRFNVDTTINLCEATSLLPGCQFIYISTGLVYARQSRALGENDPLETLHPYGASKAAADILLRAAAAEFKVPLTILRPFSFTGMGDDRNRLFPTLLRAAAQGRPCLLSPGDQVRDHCSAVDIARGILASVRLPNLSDSVRIYNLGSGHRTPLRPLIEEIVGQISLNLELRFGARDYGRYEPAYFVADTGRAFSELDWTPRHNLAHAVWQLAQASFPDLDVREPSTEVPACHLS